MFDPLQRKIFDKVSKDPLLSKQFYFTGGTALSSFYLHHRESEDLDFFSETDFGNTAIEKLMTNLSFELKLPYRFTERQVVRVCEFFKNNKLLIKVDFSYYPYKRVEKGNQYQGMAIDSIRDIATNKLLTINQRAQVKDFVDLYFLLKHFTIWDLIYGVEIKFRREMDMVLIASDFAKVEDFDFLPKMIKPLTLEELKSFFRKKAKEIGRIAVE